MSKPKSPERSEVKLEFWDYLREITNLTKPAREQKPKKRDIKEEEKTDETIDQENTDLEKQSKLHKILSWDLCRNRINCEDMRMCPNCTQTWCSPCIYEWIESKAACPNWLKVLTKNRLRKNNFAAEIIKALNTKNEPRLCSSHGEEAGLHWIDWVKYLCYECINEQPEHATHKKESVKTHFKNRETMMNDNFSKINSIVEQLQTIIKEPQEESISLLLLNKFQEEKIEQIREKIEFLKATFSEIECKKPKQTYNLLVLISRFKTYENDIEMKKKQSQLTWDQIDKAIVKSSKLLQEATRIGQPIITKFGNKLKLKPSSQDIQVLDGSWYSKSKRHDKFVLKENLWESFQLIKTVLDSGWIMFKVSCRLTSDLSDLWLISVVDKKPNQPKTTTYENGEVVECSDKMTHLCTFMLVSPYNNESYLDLEIHGYINFYVKILRIPEKDKWIWKEINEAFPQDQQQIFEQLWTLARGSKDNYVDLEKVL